MGPGGLGPPDGFGGYRALLAEALREKGIRDLGVLHAIATVPRHRFVPPMMRHRAYEDSPLPIGAGQTISQPYVQARTLELLRLSGKDRVLEVGAGSGYQTALLAALASTVLAVERVPSLRAVRCHRGRGRLALDPAAAGGAACRRRSDGDSPGRPGEPGPDAG